MSSENRITCDVCGSDLYVRRTAGGNICIECSTQRHAQLEHKMKSGGAAGRTKMSDDLDAYIDNEVEQMLSDARKKHETVNNMNVELETLRAENKHLHETNSRQAAWFWEVVGLLNQEVQRDSLDENATETREAIVPALRARFNSLRAENARLREVIKSSRLRCDMCQAKYNRERWEKLPDEPWNGETPVCEYMTDAYFFSLDEFLEHCECYEIDPNSVMLVHCDRVEPKELDAANFAYDYLPEDMECPDEIYEAAKVFNDALKKHWPQVCEASNRRVSNRFDAKEGE